MLCLGLLEEKEAGCQLSSLRWEKKRASPEVEWEKQRVAALWSRNITKISVEQMQYLFPVVGAHGLAGGCDVYPGQTWAFQVAFLSSPGPPPAILPSSRVLLLLYPSCWLVPDTPLVYKAKSVACTFKCCKMTKHQEDAKWPYETWCPVHAVINCTVASPFPCCPISLCLRRYIRC